MKCKLSFFLFLLVSTSILAQTRDRTKLNAYFDALGSNNKFMGNVLLSEKGKTVYSKSIGYADVPAAKKLQPDTKFRIGSITKMFTASLIFKAIDEKKLSTEDKLEAYFPAVPNASKITIAQLLGHKSGIHNFTDDPEYSSYLASAKTHEEMLAIINKGGSDFEPGSKTAYSNSNYLLLSYILENIYKKPYAELLEEKIARPLKLKNTYYGGRINTANNEAQSYDFLGKWNNATETDMSIPSGAGAVISTAADLTQFIEALFDGKIISDASFKQMQTLEGEFGLGIFTFTISGKKAFGHTGGIDGFSSLLVHFPEDDATAVMLSNGKSTGGIITTTMDWYAGKDIVIPEFKSFVKTSGELDKYLGHYTSKEAPIAITVYKNEMTLLAKAQGQPSFPLESTAQDTFSFSQAGVVLEFKPNEKQMVLKQNGMVITFSKEQ